ncbi:hypothetical protein M413DRAFT_439631 [Hebeloma cylindrosporum]|uniref:GYF domain-containing protein n=1 Tax=Hebeloma cylindrosporum TaxID=76867 RepID=A0A0C3CGR2_HEBCY|nr:hypothetical protein M413DRAFT_439631 [Hebeloma cylindrosporum h7]
MSTTTMQFGPEWMRTKHQPRSQLPPSPPPSNAIPASGHSTYSALVSATPPAATERNDEVHPFRYSKDELLRIYQEGGGKGGLGLEVERWEGVVRDASAEPVALREMTEAEKKLFAGPLNSELRRRASQSADYISPLTTSGLERPRLAHNSAASANSPLRERFGGLKRRDSATGPTEASTLGIPRKPSLSSLQAPAMSPREASPRTKVGYTPSFDGVLNNGDSWIARRRTEASMKTGNVPGREAAEKQQGSRSSSILEEQEDSKHSGEDRSFFPASSPQPRQYSAVVGGMDSGASADRRDAFTNGSINSRAYGTDIGPPPGLIDLAAIEWSYKDPTGQVQGPFRADLMQKWYNDGYFSSDLPMKRVRYDTHWTTVAELVQRSNGENIFFSPLMAPTLSHGNDSPSQNLPAEHMFSEPFQPAPIRSLRTSTLESYLNAGSLASDSPSSSFGASHFGNPSPDPTSFGGRENKSYVGADLNGRMPGFALQDHTSIFGDRRPIGHEFPVNPLINEYQTALQPQGSSFGNVVRDRDNNFNSYTFNNSPASHDTWTASNIHASAFGHNREQGSDRLFSSLNTQTSVHLNQIQAHTEGNHQEPFPTIFNQDVIHDNDSLGDHNGQSPGPTDLLNYGHYDFSGQSFHNAQEMPPSRDLDEGPANTFGFRNLNVDTVISQPPRNISPTLPAQSPWEVLPDPSINQRPATVNAIPQPLANPDAQPVASTSQHSPWHRVDQNQTFNAQIPAPQIPSNLPTGGLGQHNRQEELSDALHNPSLGSLVQQRDTLPAPDSAPIEPAVLSPIRPSTRTSSNQQSSPDQITTGNSTPVPFVQKAAWAKEEEGKRKKGSNPSLNIREIQEAEAKKMESRKAAERQKDRSARATSTMDTKEDHQPFTTSWGLPTSQAGARGNITTREPLVATAQTPPSTHVWTTPLKQPIAKKTMKEIQEEEETRKRLVAKETPALVVPKKAHAETTKSAAAVFASSSNNAWTTVGPSGKTSAVLTSTLRPSAPTSSGSGVSAVPRVSSSPVLKAPPAPALKSRPSASKPDTLNETPSHEFLKWLSDSLKGLNSSVNVEEIVSMLLSFPLEPDASTLEIISDTIYSNSTTLDGRRFASDFVARRKADAHARSKSSSIPGKAAAKPVSIADVVKAAPKAAQPEWGFKVVNKKKKGGRS